MNALTVDEHHNQVEAVTAATMILAAAAAAASSASTAQTSMNATTKNVTRPAEEHRIQVEVSETATRKLFTNDYSSTSSSSSSSNIHTITITDGAIQEMIPAVTTASSIGILPPMTDLPPLVGRQNYYSSSDDSSSDADNDTSNIDDSDDDSTTIPGLQERCHDDSSSDGERVPRQVEENTDPQPATIPKYINTRPIIPQWLYDKVDEDDYDADHDDDTSQPTLREIRPVRIRGGGSPNTTVATTTGIMPPTILAATTTPSTTAATTTATTLLAPSATAATTTATTLIAPLAATAISGFTTAAMAPVATTGRTTGMLLATTVTGTRASTTTPLMMPATTATMMMAPAAAPTTTLMVPMTTAVTTPITTSPTLVTTMDNAMEQFYDSSSYDSFSEADDDDDDDDDEDNTFHDANQEMTPVVTTATTTGIMPPTTVAATSLMMAAATPTTVGIMPSSIVAERTTPPAMASISTTRATTTGILPASTVAATALTTAAKSTKTPATTTKTAATTTNRKRKAMSSSTKNNNKKKPKTSSVTQFKRILPAHKKESIRNRDVTETTQHKLNEEEIIIATKAIIQAISVGTFDTSTCCPIIVGNSDEDQGNDGANADTIKHYQEIWDGLLQFLIEIGDYDSAIICSPTICPIDPYPVRLDSAIMYLRYKVYNSGIVVRHPTTNEAMKWKFGRRAGETIVATGRWTSKSSTTMYRAALQKLHNNNPVTRGLYMEPCKLCVNKKEGNGCAVHSGCPLIRIKGNLCTDPKFSAYMLEINVFQLRQEQ